MYVRSSAEENKVTVTPISGICYFYQKNSILSKIPEKEFVPSNYLVFDIVAPKEFDANGNSFYGNNRRSPNYNAAFKNFVYQNSIVKDGKGYVLIEDKQNGKIRVAFPVTAADKAEKRTFTILWEKLNGENYTEEYTVDLSNAKLEDDLRTAVAPKSLAFNGVVTKMTVGETQQLDVKMTKVLNSDVVFLNYKVAEGSEKFASVTTETGVVTALKKGKATIEVYPVRRNAKGEVERIPDFRKTVKTTITVNDVTAPKINSVYAYDYQFELKYTQPADGYRREVYVLEGKKKETDFVTALSGVQDGGKNKLNEAFVAYKYLTPADEISDSEKFDEKTKVVTTEVGGIKPGKEYTVYVRNVSGVRKLDDDSQVTVSALGKVKTFKATKVQLLSIRLDYKTDEEMAKKTPDDDKIYKDSIIHEIDLSKGSVQLQALGEFKMQPEKESAEDSAYGIDHEWKEFPLNKSDAVYETQKLTYYAVESTTGYKKDDIAKYKLDGYKTLIGNEYYRPSTIAKIDKKGKLTLKGVGVVYIIAYDSVSKKITPMNSGHLANIDRSREVSKDSSHYALRITSPISKIQAKTITLKAGSHVSVRPSLTFLNDKNKKIAIGANDTSIPITVKNADSEAVEVKGDYIIAKEPDQRVELTVCLKNDPKVEAKLTVQTKKMDPVKAVKAVDVIDHSARITFTHTGNEIYSNYMGSEPIRFRIDLLDNRKRLISSHIENCTIDQNKTNGKKSTYAYYYEIQGLKRQSVYNVTVTPIYGKKEAAKGANGKVKTTNIPAWGNTSIGKNPDGSLETGGMTIYIDSTSGEELGDIGYLTSGNVYTLIANADSTARARKSDTLTWKSTNSKVASVKANTGSYTATLKAASVGYTYIEVTSKVTKKVIARYIVRVKSVSNGGQGAYGDTEPKNNVVWDASYDQGVEVLTEKNPVSFRAPMGAYDYRWISFTAPADGSYSFDGSNVDIAGYYHKTDFPEQYDGGNKSSFEDGNGNGTELDEGDTIYFKAAGDSNSKGKTVTVVVTDATKYGKLTGSDAVSVAGLGQVSFTAPEDNYYTFYATESGKQAYCSLKGGYITFATEAGAVTDDASVGLTKGQTVTLTGLTSGDYSISVKGRTYTAFDAAGKASTGSLSTKEGSVKDKWFVFEAKAAGEYTFTIAADKTGAMEAMYDTELTKPVDDATEITPAAADGKDTFTIGPISLNEDNKIAIYVRAKNEEAVSADVTVSQPKTAEVSLAAATGELEVKNGAPVWVSFKVPETGKEYCFSYAGDAEKVNRDYYKNTVGSGSDFHPASDRFTSVKDDKIIYIRLSTMDAAAKVKVSVKETAATAIALATDAPFEVTKNNKQFFTFTASTTGLYRLETTLAAESAGKTVSAGKVNDISQTMDIQPLGTDNVKKLLAGEKQLLAVGTESNDAVKGNLEVTAITVNPLEAKEYTFAAGEIKYFKYTPGAAGKYKIACTGSVTDVYWGSALDDIVSGMPYDNTLSAGDAVYVKAANRAGTESKLTFTITAMEQPLPADGKISVKVGSTVTYKYPVKQTGRYRVTWTSDPADAGVTVNYSKSRMASGDEIVCDTKGETVVFRVEAANKDATVTLKVEPIVPSTTLEATVAKEGGVQWFEYTAPATGRYTMALADDAGKAIAADANVSAVCTRGKITNEDEEDFDASPDSPWIVWLEKGDKRYFKVQNESTADQKVKIMVIPVTASEKLEVGAEPKTPTFTENEVKWYGLTLTKDARYDITVEGAEIALWQDRYGLKGSDNAITVSSSGTRRLAKGTYFVQARKAGDAAAKIGIKEVPVLELKEGEDLAVTFSENGTQYITFKPSKTAYYAFRLKDTDGVDSVFAGITATTEGGSSAWITLSKVAAWSYCPKKLAVAKNNDITLSLNFTPTEEVKTKTVKLSVEEIKPAELKTELSVSVEKGAMSFFTFTASETGYYDFAEDSKDVVVKANYAINSTDLPATYNSNMSFPGRIYLEENKKVTFGVYYDSKKPDSTAETVPAKADFKVSVKKFEPEELSLKTANTIAFAENETEKWYALKPEYCVAYQLKFTGSEGTINVSIDKGTSYVANWDSMDLAGGELTQTINLEGGEIYLVKITSQDHPTFQLNVSAGKLPVDLTKAVQIGVGDENTPVAYVTIGSDDYALYRFTAPASGWYTFYTAGYEEDGGQDSHGTLYDERLNELADHEDIGDDYDFAIAKELEAGKTYYLKVRGWNDQSLDNCPLHVVRGYINFGQDDVVD